MTDRQLKMSFDTKTIEHLGVKMYSQIPNAIAELIANAYDADAEKVHIKLYDDGQNKRIEVIDDGIGMDFDEINQKFLRIGRNRRIEGATKSPGGRKATGKKGLGKLALFGIGDLIEVMTVKENSQTRIKFTLSWDDLKGTQGQDYTPAFEIENCDVNEKGTTIILKNLRRESAFDTEGLAISLSKLFNCFGSDFRCYVSLNDEEPIEINNELKFKNIDEQFKWNFPDFSNSLESDYTNKENISGEIISTEKPLKPGLRGITLFANGRMVNAAEFFGIPESSHVFSYLAGWLNVDFIDNIEEDVISTNRQSLNWELPIIADLRDFLVMALRKVIAEWRVKRNEANKKAVSDQTNINTEKWFNTLPDDVRSDVQSIVDSVVAETETPTERQASVIRMVHNLVPEYPCYHWRHIHQAVREVSEDEYRKGDYYEAFIKTIKKYASTIQDASGITDFKGEAALMGTVFGSEADKIFKVASKYKKPNGHDFSTLTTNSIEDGQKHLSMGLVSAARNPLSHNDYNDLRESGLFNEKDCLDALSILSHLFRRLDDAIEACNNNSSAS